MRRITTTTAVADKFGVGKSGFRDGDPSIGQVATDLNAEWFDGIQEAIMRVVEASGQALAAGDFDQFQRALETMFSTPALTTTGAAPHFVLTPSLALSAYAARRRFRVKFNVNGTGADDINISGLGVRTLKQYDASGVKVAPTIVAGMIADIEDDGVDLVILNRLPAPGLASGIPLMWPTMDCPAWAVVRDGSALTRTVYPALYAILAPLRSATLTMNAGGAVVSGLSRTSDLWVGMPAEHANLPAGTTVKSIDSASQVTLTNNATATVANTSVRLFLHGYGVGGTAATFGLPDDRGLFERGVDTGARAYEKTTLTGALTNASNTVTGLTTTRGMFVGMTAAHSAIPAGATVVAILSATSVQLSGNATSTVSADVIWGGGQVGNERTDTGQGHFHVNTLNSGKGYTPGGTVNDFMNPAISIATSQASGVGAPTTDGVNGTPRIGPETRGRFRNYLPIMVI